MAKAHRHKEKQSKTLCLCPSVPLCLLFLFVLILPACTSIHISESASEIHRRATVVDVHSCTFFLVRYGFYSLGKEHTSPLNPYTYISSVDIPRLRQGGVDAVFFSIFAEPFDIRPDRPFHHAMKMIDLVHREIDENSGQISLALSAEDVKKINASGKVAAVITVDGGHVLEGDRDNLQRLHDRGVRAMGLVHTFSNDLAISSADSRPAFSGLTDFGRDVVREMNRLGMMIDLAHCAESAFWRALEESRAPVIVSHTAAAAIHPHHRNLTDDQIEAVARNGGVVGVILYPRYLNGGFLTHLDRFVDHIEHIVRLAGIEAVAIGSDFDGITLLPRGMRDVRDLPRLTQLLLDRGFGESEIAGIMGGNIMRVFREVGKSAR